jgi:hypothetical protein
MDPIKTAARVKKYLDSNKKKIGLDHVRFSVSMQALPTEDEFASIILLDGSWATLNLSPMWMGLDEESRHQVLCHELAHLFLWDLQGFAEASTKCAFASAAGGAAGDATPAQQALFQFGLEQYETISERTTERVGDLIARLMPVLQLR